MLATLGLLTITVAVLATVDLAWYTKIGIALGVQGARVAWLLWLCRRDGAGMTEMDEQVW